MIEELRLGEHRLVPLASTDAMERVHVMVAAAARATETRAVRDLASGIVKSCAVRDDEAPHACWARTALSTVQSLGREIDPPAYDVLADPLAVLTRGRGDCLTLSTLLLALLSVLGVKAHLVKITQKCAVDDHVALLVWVNDLWWWADAASTLPLGQVETGNPCPLPSEFKIL